MQSKNNLTLTSEDAEDVTVPITGVAQARVPTVMVTPASLDFATLLDKTESKTINLTGAFLEGDVTVTLNDENGVFNVSPTTISKNNISENTPVQVTVSFNSAVEGTFNGTVTFASQGAESKTVALTATARDGGTATDPYLNIANYATIDEAGATVSGMSKIYKYTEYPADGCAWLTLSNYGALKADANQNWYETTSLSQYGNDWTATDVFLGDAAYFGSNSGYSIYGQGTQTFYVTNCAQVKAYVKGSSGGSSDNAKLSIYECTLNADGTLTSATTATDTKQGTNGVIASAAINPSNIYKVELKGGGSYPDLLEIGFKTELNQPMIIANPSSLTISAAPGETGTATINVRGKMLPGDIAVALNDPDNVFTVSTTSISKVDAEAGKDISITFKSDVEANYEGSITLTSGDLITVVNLTGRCNNGGTASDKYLNIAKYATIDDAGATVSDMKSIYKYKEYEADNCGWLTVCNYGALKADASQNWFTSEAFSSYSHSWEATSDDVFLGSGEYFSGTARAIYGNYSQYFYVTNCTQVKAYLNGSGSSSATLSIYECTVDDNGNPTAATTATDTKEATDGVITSKTLDVNNIYMVRLKTTGSYPDLLEIGFQTPLAKVQEATLAEILAEGVNDTEYIVSNDLAVVASAEYANNTFITDGEGNWICVTADDAIFNQIYNKTVIKGGTLKGVLSGIELNPVLTATAAPEQGDVSISSEIEFTNLSEHFAPKVNQVLDIKGFWNAHENALCAYDASTGNQGQMITFDYTWGAESNNFVDGDRYLVRCAMTIKEAWKAPNSIRPMDYDREWQNYVAHALSMPPTSTGISTVGLDSQEIVNVYSLQGMILKQNVKAGEALKGLPRGVYIVGNKKVVVK